MKISTAFHKKVPVPGLEYASQGFHLTIEAEPPPEIQQDREKLRRYVQSLFKECRERVEQEMEANEPPASPPLEERRPTIHRRQFQPPVRSSASNGRNGRTPRGSNGHTTNGHASPKQINFVRALASQAGLSYDELAELAAEQFGKPELRSLTKREASMLIDDLRGDEGS